MASFTVEPGERWYMFSQSALDELIANERAAERQACSERAWIALVNHKQPWNVRQDVTEAIRERGETK